MALNNHIVFVIGSLDYGGAERHLTQVLPALAARGWIVEVLTLSAPGAQAPILRAKGIRVLAPPLAPRPGNIFYRIARLLVATLWFGAHMATTRPNLVHFFLPQAYLIGGLMSLLTGPSLRVMSRRSRNFYQRRHSWMARIERRLHGQMTAVLGNSRPVAIDLAEEGVRPERLGLIYNGIDLEPFESGPAAATVRKALGIAEVEVVFVVVANLIPYKGHEDLLRALAIAEFPQPWRLVCIGRDDGILNGLRTLAAHLGIGGQVLWMGARTDIAALLRAADVGVLPSHEEGFSNAVLEYMAAGLPTVVTDVGGNSEAVVDGQTGFVVPVGDLRAMAAALRQLADRDVRRRMGGDGRTRAVAVFSLDHCVDDYDGLYTALLASLGVPGHLRADRLLPNKRFASINTEKDDSRCAE